MSVSSRTGGKETSVSPGQSVSQAPGLSVVELEVCSRCNRQCSYCPVSLDPMPPVPARMSDEVFLRAVDQLERVSFAGRISYHLYNEPLLRTDLARLVAIVAERLPNALQVLNTNGDLLDERRYTDLRAAGIDYFYVTRHSPGDYPERSFQVLQTWQDLTLTNRGGSLTHLPMPKPRAAHTPCWAPSEMLIVTVTGEVLLCYEDAGREHVMGNLMHSTLPEIWNSEGFRAIRESLRQGERSVDGMCTKCSNLSHSRPGLSALEEPVLAANGLSRRSAAPVTTLKHLSAEARAEPS